jgi:hypothetical protein
VPLVPTRLAPDHGRHYPGIGDHADPAPSQACLRSTSHCPCPFSPRNVRLGRLSPRRRVWSPKRRARSGGVFHTSERLKSRLHLAFSRPPVRGLRPRAPRAPILPHAAVPVQTALHRAPHGCGPLRVAAARWARSHRRGRGVAAGGGVRPGGGAKRPFILPICSPRKWWTSLGLCLPSSGSMGIRMNSYHYLVETLLLLSQVAGRSDVLPQARSATAQSRPLRGSDQERCP